jgi:hypothetical protein
VAVLIDPGGPYDSSNGVVVPQSILKTLENYDTDTFASPITVRPGVEREALPIRAEEVKCRHRHHGVWGEDHASASSDSLKTSASLGFIVFPDCNTYQ